MSKCASHEYPDYCAVCHVPIPGPAAQAVLEAAVTWYPKQANSTEELSARLALLQAIRRYREALG